MLKKTVFHRVSWLLGYREVPFAVRGIFRRELFHMMCWGVAWGSLNADFCCYIARRSLGASALLMAVITASTTFGNLLAVGWAALMSRRSKKTLLLNSLYLMAVILFIMVLTPYANRVTLEDVGPWFGRWTSATYPLTALLFTLQIVALWLVVQGVNTIRTTLWKLNYPDQYRGRIMARFTIWQMLFAVAWVTFIGTYFDGHLNIVNSVGQSLWKLDLGWLPGAGTMDSYRYMFPLAGVAALLCVLFYKNIPVRCEQKHRLPPSEARFAMETVPSGDVLPRWFGIRWDVLRIGLVESYKVLKSDRRFRQYILWLFLSGSAVIIVDVPFLLILDQRFKLSYLQAAGLVVLLPQIMMIASMSTWGRLFDRWSIYRFRTVQVAGWGLGRFLLAWGVWKQSIGLLVLAKIVGSVAEGGGRFAWQLGHMNFSTRANDGLYMGVHQTLTGIRGLIMPFAGVVLYRYCIGEHLIWVSAVVLSISAWGYWRMHNDPQ